MPNPGSIKQSPYRFRGLVEPKDSSGSIIIPGMDVYHIVLYLTMKIWRTAVLLQSSTITKEAHHRRYYELLDKFAVVKHHQLLVLRPLL